MESPEQLGKYTVEKELSTSSICTVYRAREESLRRPVLIKKLHPQMAREEDIRLRFEREARVCAQLSHENIVAIYGFYVDPELTMLVLEYVDGDNLGSVIKRYGSLPWAISLSILAGVLTGLKHSHSKGVVHRDIKPDNILISKDGRVKITDFGLATLEDAPKLTMQGVVVGTPSYMAPESVSSGVIDARSDLFSCGVMFYEALTGISPFQGNGFSETMNKILKDTPPKPSSFVKNLPVEVDQIVMRLLEKQPNKRYPSAAQALEDIQLTARQYDISTTSNEIGKFLSHQQGNDKSETPFRSTSSHKINIQRSVIKKPTKRIPIWIYFLGGLLLLMLTFWLPKMIKIEIPSSEYKSQGDVVIVDNDQTLTPVHPESVIIDELVMDKPLASEARKESVEDKTIEPPGDDSVISELERSLTEVDETTDYPPYRFNDPIVKGTLNLTVRPWANVFIDDIRIGQSPLKSPILLEPGQYQLVLINDEFPSPVVEQIELGSGETVSLDIDLWSRFALFRFVSVKPWAEIIINDISYGHTPLARPIILPFGTHIVELKNPNFHTWRQQFTVKKGDNPIEINVSLTPLEDKN